MMPAPRCSPTAGSPAGWQPACREAPPQEHGRLRGRRRTGLEPDAAGLARPAPRPQLASERQQWSFWVLLEFQPRMEVVMPFRFPQRWTERCAELLKSLNNNGVKYLLIGSMARELHGSSGHQPNDTDLMIACSDQNAERARRAVLCVFPDLDNESNRRELSRLSKLGIQLPLPGKPYGQDVHVITPLEAFDFDGAWARSTRTNIPCYDIGVRIASVEDLARLDEIRRNKEVRDRGRAEHAGTPTPNEASLAPHAAGAARLSQREAV